MNYLTPRAKPLCGMEDPTEDLTGKHIPKQVALNRFRCLSLIPFLAMEKHSRLRYFTDHQG